MRASPEQASTVEACDREIERYWSLLRDDPKADPDECREQIDRWLDRRLALKRAVLKR